jgi:hypothetical protein
VVLALKAVVDGTRGLSPGSCCNRAFGLFHFFAVVTQQFDVEDDSTIWLVPAMGAWLSRAM